MGVKGSRVKQIEELSGTVISFQKNPTPTGAVTSTTPDSVEVTAQTASNKVRELTILGASHQAIEHAKHLIYTTIQRNISPTRSQHTDELSTAIGSIDSRLTKLNAEVFTLFSEMFSLELNFNPFNRRMETEYLNKQCNSNIFFTFHQCFP